MRETSIVIVIISLVLLTGCASIETKWERAKDTDTIETYREFLAEDPPYALKQKARAKIETIRFEQAKKAKSLEEFLRLYPQGNHAFEARVLLDKQRFVKATTQHTVEAYMMYLELFPSGIHAGEAIERLEELRFSRAKRVATIEAYTEFLAKHPNGERKGDAQSALAKLQRAQILSKIDSSHIVLTDGPIRWVQSIKMGVNFGSLDSPTVGMQPDNVEVFEARPQPGKTIVLAELKLSSEVKWDMDIANNISVVMPDGRSFDPSGYDCPLAKDAFWNLFSPDKVSLGAGETKSFKMMFSIPRDGSGSAVFRFGAVELPIVKQ